RKCTKSSHYMPLHKSHSSYSVVEGRPFFEPIIMSEALIVTAIALPLFAGLLFLWLQKLEIRNLGLISSSIAFTSLICILFIWDTLPYNETLLVNIPWIPSIGVNISLIVDGLSLFFGIMVTGMGILVNIYANYYMDPNEEGLGRFYCCLTSFMGSMLGVIFSDNLILLYLFWEMTGIFSFLLIGYYRQDTLAANNARLAFMTTFLTGIFLFVAIILIGILDGTYLWSQIIEMGMNYTDHPFWSYLIMIFFLIAIFGKSVQLPFHFWLPKAMVAPIPVSSFLHAATMVKLGIFLTARFYPLFQTSEIWAPTVMVVCFSTMLFGAVLSLLANDLKELLAYATISQLGFFLGFYGLGGTAGVKYDFIHIFNHALYKGSLFMLVGIIQKATGIRDIRYLGGLWKHMPLVTVTCFLAAGSMAGIPGTTGFLSKELVLSDLFERDWHPGLYSIVLLLVATMIFKVAFSVRIFAHLFIRSPKGDKFKVNHPGYAIQISPFILSALAFIFGIWPAGLEMFTGSFFVSSLHLETTTSLQLLHGWKFETVVSIGILLFGVGLFLIAEKSNLWWHHHKIPDWGGFCDNNIERLTTFANRFTSFIHPDSQSIKVGLLLLGFVLAIFWPLSLETIPHENLIIHSVRLAISVFILFAVAAVTFFRLPMAKLLSLSISGFLLTLYFVYFLAPDLAITQLLVEVITLMILIMVFALASNRAAPRKIVLSTVPRVTLSVCVGIAAVSASWVFFQGGVDSGIDDFFISNALTLAKGKNLVNIILVDYRGLDTVGESAVLVIASMAIWSLLQVSTSPKVIKLIPSSILKPMITCFFWLVNIYALYLLLRGHNQPGGGFIAGLATGISFILLCMDTQTRDILSLSWFRAQKLAAIGLLLMIVVATTPFLLSKYMLTHYPWNIPTPLLFDIGVYFVVVSVTVGIYLSMRTRLSRRDPNAY
ncbi:MAG: hydrogen gas-evolving membrane-bound hydrogenase subunit E, partial [Chlamydiota bacterium]